MNLYDTSTPQSGEALTTLLAHKNIRINRIVSSEDVEAAEYLQEEDEWLVLLEGKATLLLADQERTLTKGETLFIPSMTPHRVLDTQRGTLWLTVHIF